MGHGLRLSLMWKTALKALMNHYGWLSLEHSIITIMHTNTQEWRQREELGHNGDVGFSHMRNDSFISWVPVLIPATWPNHRNK